jgi:hypothetical protein
LNKPLNTALTGQGLIGIPYINEQMDILFIEKYIFRGFMERKRIKNRLKRQYIRQDRKKMSQASPQNVQGNPFNDPCFWFSLATIDFSGLFGITIHNHEE